MNPLLIGGGLAIAGALLVAGIQTIRLERMTAEMHEERAAHADEMHMLADAAAKETQRHRDTEAAWRVTQQENERAQLQAIERARMDSAGAARADVRLWQRYSDAIAARCGGAAQDPTALAAGPAASEAAGVLADVPRRVGAAARLYADLAELALVAGERCAADYDALGK